MEKAMSISEEDAIQITYETDPGGYLKLNEEEKPQHLLLELKPLSPRLKNAFLQQKQQ